MNDEFQRRMAEAARLMRGGSLMEATAAIQQALGVAPAAPAAPTRADDDVIDVEARVVDEAETRSGEGAEARVAGERPARSEPTARSSRDSQAGVVDTPGARARRARPESFTPGHFKNEAGARDYKLFEPARDGGPLPLVVMLHGCTQDPDDFARGTRMNALARARGFLVLYPAQSQRANPQRCWNWFKHNHQDRGRGEPAILAGLVREVMAAHDVDPARVYVAGLSAGGAMAAILGEAFPDLFAAVGVHSGLPVGAASDAPSAFAAMKGGARIARRAARPGAMPPTIVFHGDADATVNVVNGEQVLEATGLARSPAVERAATPAGVPYSRRAYLDGQGAERGELWTLHGAGHAWSGGDPAGSYTDARGPDASAEMLRFFLAHPKG